MSRHAHVRVARVGFGASAPSRVVLFAMLFFGCSVAQAAQPLSDHELKNRYLSYSADENDVIVVLAQATTLTQSPQLLSRTLRLIDVENTDNLLFWQDRQALSVGSRIGLQDINRQALFEQPIANFGSEPFSLRWSGNLDQVIEISRISGFSLYGINIDLFNISGGLRIDAQTF